LSLLSWPLFCKEALPDRNFTFWEWFHRILLLTQQHLSKLWQKGFVMGFISKPLAEQMLLEKQSGTFLLRFSDSELGGVTIAYVRQPDMYPGRKYTFGSL
jgi:signal transducer and activator of transcription 5B